MHRFRLGAQVEISANSCTYRGELRGMSETEVYVRTALKTWTIPMDGVKSLRYLDESTPRMPFQEKTDPGGYAPDSEIAKPPDDGNGNSEAN